MRFVLSAGMKVKVKGRTAQARAGQETTGQARAGQNMTRQGRAGQDRAGRAGMIQHSTACMSLKGKAHTDMQASLSTQG